MSRNNIDKVLKRIEKGEEKSLKILFKQRKDLLKALEDNERLIETKLTRGANAQENKVEQEIEKLTRVNWHRKSRYALCNIFVNVVVVVVAGGTGAGTSAVVAIVIFVIFVDIVVVVVVLVLVVDFAGGTGAGASAVVAIVIFVIFVDIVVVVVVHAIVVGGLVVMVADLHYNLVYEITR